MNPSEVNRSTIDLAIQSLERTHQLKKEEMKSRNTDEKLFRASDLLTQPVDSLFTPLLQIQSVLKQSAGVFKKAFDKMQQDVKADPYALLVKVVMGSIGFGLIISRRMHQKSSVKK